VEEQACVPSFSGRLLQARDTHHELCAPVSGIANAALDKLLERERLFQLVNDLQLLKQVTRPGQLLTATPHRVVRYVWLAPPVNAIQANRHGLGRTAVRLSQLTPPPNRTFKPRHHAGGSLGFWESDAMLTRHEGDRLSGESFRHVRRDVTAAMGDGIGKASNAVIIQMSSNWEIEKFTVTTPKLIRCAVTAALLIVR
jgi:hypothetical protein